MMDRSLMVHGGLFLFASLLGVRAWTAEEDSQKRHFEAELWSGSPEQVTRISYEEPKTKVQLVQEKDERGAYFVGVVDRLKKMGSSEIGDPDEMGDEVDEGVGGASSAAGVDPEPGSDEWVKEEFVSVEEGSKLLESLAPLRVKRKLGRLDAARLGDFGLEKAEGMLEVVIGETKHTLSFGAATPGGSDTYVQTPDGEAYVIAGDVARSLRHAGSRLMERSFHAFKPDDVHHVRVAAGGKTRDLLRMGGEERFTWANAETPDDKDETASNWMTKVERLRVLKYVREPQPAVQPGESFVRVEYFDNRDKPLGQLELVKRPGTGDHAEYYGRSEQSRWYATVVRSTAEQIEQDLSSVLNP